VRGDGPEAEDSAASAPLVVESPVAAATPQPITVGLPIPRGRLPWGRPVSLLDPSGRAIPVQAAPTARWPDGSVQWVLLDFVAGPLDPGPSMYSVRWDRGPGACEGASGATVRLRDEGGAISVGTGAASFALDPGSFGPWDRIEVDGRSVLEPGGASVLLADRRGRLHQARLGRRRVEVGGPIRATVRCEGTLGGRRERLRVVARLSFFAGLSAVRIELTLHNPRPARHRGGLWDLGDPGSIFFRDLSLRLAPTDPGPWEVRWTEGGGPCRSSVGGRFAIYQGSSGGDRWQSRNHVNRLGEVAPTIRGYVVEAGTGKHFGLRASPVVALRGRETSLTVAVPRFWEEFPKAVESEGGCHHVRLFPGRYGEPFELQGGEQKTQTVWLDFGAPGPAEPGVLRWVHDPARARSTPEWYAATGAVPYLPPAPRPVGGRRESYFTAVVEGPRSFFAGREAIDEYGWRNFGEIHANHEEAHYQGPRPVISHYNNQYDVALGLLVHELRTGDARWRELREALARHVVDIDIYKTDRDRAAYNGGLFWHTDHYRDAATCTHRCYSRANRRPGSRSYGGGPCNEHNYATGLLYHYYLSGDPQAAESVARLADWVVAMDDGSRTILGAIDDGPTGWASCTRSMDYHGPGRGAGNSVNVLLDAWQLTGSPAYLAEAEELIRRVIHPEDDLDALDLLDAERRWSYTVFLSALDRYLGLKAGAGLLDDAYAYAQQSLVHYAGWMAEHESPYLDRAERLEYPTETWAAQDLRKANVLRLASAHADEPLRSGLLRKADALADRAWDDLDGFASRHVARCLALVMLEGLRDADLRACPPPRAPRATAPRPFGRPSAFVPQKLRVLDALRTPRGAARALLALADPRRLLARRRGRRGDPAIST
jgi:hypothetical protein